MVKHRAVLLSKSTPTYKLKKTENIHTKTCTPIFTAVLFTVAGVETIQISTDEWINKCGTSIQWNIIQHKKR